MIFGNITRMVHSIMTEEMQRVLDASQKIVAVDGTLGNGYDTLFLSELIGEKGSVTAFDIQQLAIDSAEEMLNGNGVSNVRLVHDGHQNIDQYVASIDVAMFNLGYLPKGDHGIITLPETTIEALDKVIERLNPKGIVSIIAYYGHEGGVEEKNAVARYVEKLDYRSYQVVRVEQANKDNNPPIVTFIRRISSK